MKLKIAPSILSADFGRLNEEIKEVEPYADLIHLDIMDGHFVPNISYGAPVVKDIKTKLPLDCHLMITDPVKYAKDFAPYVDRIFFHAEVFEKKPAKLVKAIEAIKKLKVDVGLTLNPDKPLSLIVPVLDEVDAVLIMSVFAGFGGQKFIPNVLDKVIELSEKHAFDKDIVIDGGIDKTNIRQALDAGANVFVAGSSLFGQKNRKKAIEDMRNKLV